MIEGMDERISRTTMPDSLLQDPLARLRYFPLLGKFILPEENTWAAQSLLVKDPQNTIGFNPVQYPYFDKIIADKFNRTLDNTHHPEYPRLEGLRVNLATLRNAILVHYCQAGALVGSDKHVAARMHSIATHLAEVLTSEPKSLRFFGRPFNTEITRIEGIGASEMYFHLLEVQEKPGQSLMKTLKASLTKQEDDRAWELPPIEDMPFSRDGLAAPPPQPHSREKLR